MLFGGLAELRIEIFTQRSFNTNKKAIKSLQRKIKSNQVLADLHGGAWGGGVVSPAGRRRGDAELGAASLSRQNLAQPPGAGASSRSAGTTSRSAMRRPGARGGDRPAAWARADAEVGARGWLRWTGRRETAAWWRVGGSGGSGEQGASRSGSGGSGEQGAGRQRLGARPG
jgi:hypothetical protein